jgi:hypothetical protein
MKSCCDGIITQSIREPGSLQLEGKVTKQQPGVDIYSPGTRSNGKFCALISGYMASREAKQNLVLFKVSFLNFLSPHGSE